MNQDYGSQDLYYEKFYNLINVRGAGAASRAFQKLHQRMEKPYNEDYFKEVLEIGAGTGEHLDFVQHKFDSYVLSDIRECKLPVKYREDSRIKQVVANAESLPFADSTFDKINVTCLLHHVENPEKVIKEISRLLKAKGKAMIYLTCDPGLAVRFVRRITTHRIAKKNGFKGFSLLMAREHRNHVGSLLELIKYVFRQDKLEINYVPFKIKSWNLNGAIIINISRELTP
jgi:phosphatidylethanolamine/phosphatidyl-N-methylethanolamine N-methyltransferase